SLARLRDRREAARSAWTAAMAAAGVNARTLSERIEAAGALGIVTGNWNRGWGVNFNYRRAYTTRIPTVDLSCEDYGLVHRLAENGQGPTLRIDAKATLGPEAPVYNTLAEISGDELPDEYVMLSAHFDSWHTASGATDNGTGTIAMMEAMRILKEVYRRPKRTILVGHWSGEEQGLNGSRAWVADNPEIVAGIQAVFNQDNGTGRISRIDMQGFTGAAAVFRRWFARIPAELVSEVSLESPGTPSSGGSDHSSFVCASAPAFMLSSRSWDYGTYTWHTNRDTFDKLVFDEVQQNAVLIAMLAYLAAEDSVRLPREKRTDLANPRTGETGVWPVCQPAVRMEAESIR
ncbi:MAG: M20/M25/M40 family metallo-hydrolase, partial [Gemmatimonadota bacterium]|nr:M20/M25/M40 family metallo-hydrolase [Gemmatimonadota bacterium]